MTSKLDKGIAGFKRITAVELVRPMGRIGPFICRIPRGGDFYACFEYHWAQISGTYEATRATIEDITFFKMERDERGWAKALLEMAGIIFDIVLTGEECSWGPIKLGISLVAMVLR